MDKIGIHDRTFLANRHHKEQLEVIDLFQTKTCVSWRVSKLVSISNAENRTRITWWSLRWASLGIFHVEENSRGVLLCNDSPRGDKPIGNIWTTEKSHFSWNSPRRKASLQGRLQAKGMSQSFLPSRHSENSMAKMPYMYKKMHRCRLHLMKRQHLRCTAMQVKNRKINWKIVCDLLVIRFSIWAEKSEEKSSKITSNEVHSFKTFK